MKPLDPISVVHLFPEERAALLDVLRSLEPEKWARDTVCAGWSVKDIAQHLIADDIGRLSGGRDGYSAGWFESSDEETFEADLLDFINRKNEAWVAATRHLSPRVIVDLLEQSGRDSQSYFETLDPEAPSLGVSWAGEAQSATWFDLAREYTERWHHQAQIREGAGVPLLTEPRLFAPVIATFVRGIPHAFRETNAPDDTHVSLRITGNAGGAWSLVRADGRWQMVQPLGGDEAASVEIDQDTAWRLFTKGTTPAEARERATLGGDAALAARVLDTVSIIT